MQQVHQQTLIDTLRDFQVPQQGFLTPKQQIQSHGTLLQHLNKRKLHPIKMKFGQQITNDSNQREFFAKSQIKKKIVEKKRVNPRKLRIQLTSKRSNQEASVDKNQERGSLSFQLSRQQRDGYKKNIFFDQFVPSPKQRLQSLKIHLKAVREQDQTYLKNKMNVIKQKIKRKRQKVPHQQSNTIFRQKKEQRSNQKSIQRPSRLKIQRYDDNLQYDLIRQSIQVQKCQVLNFSSNRRDSLKFQKQESRPVNKTQMNIRQRKSKKLYALFQQNQRIKAHQQNSRRFTKLESQLTNEESYKMMLVNRLNPLKNFISIIKPEKSLEKLKFNTENSEVQQFFKIKSFSQATEAEKTSHKFSKSFDISLIKKIQKRLSSQTTAQNFIKGSVIYRLLKQRSRSKNVENIIAQVQNEQKQQFNEKQELQAYHSDQTELQLYQNIESEEKKDIKKRKKVVLSNKNISKYRNEAQSARQDQLSNRIDQNKQQMRSKLYFQQSLIQNVKNNKAK